MRVRVLRNRRDAEAAIAESEQRHEARVTRRMVEAMGEERAALPTPGLFVRSPQVKVSGHAAGRVKSAFDPGMESNGKLSSGPFPNQEKCLTGITQPRSNFEHRPGGTPIQRPGKRRLTTWLTRKLLRTLRSSDSRAPRLEQRDERRGNSGKPVVTTTADKSMLDVAKLLTQHSIGCIVIERDDGEVAGIVSERDLMRSIGQSGAKVLMEPVSVYMTKTVVTARETDTSDQLMSEMTLHRFRHMPVVERGRLLGLVSIGDLVKIHVADAEFESDALRQYITPQPSLIFDQASRLSLAGGA